MPRFGQEFDSPIPLQRFFNQPEIVMTESRARYTSQEAAEMIGNRFEMVLIASARVRELKRGHKSKLDKPTTAGPTVVALMEIEKGLVGREYLKQLR